jgi:hypothetical protein
VKEGEICLQGIKIITVILSLKDMFLVGGKSLINFQCFFGQQPPSDILVDAVKPVPTERDDWNSPLVK